MSTDPFSALEYESMIFGRHQSTFVGRAGKSAGALDQSAYILLTLLQVQGPSSISELSVITGLDTSTLNRQTKSLVEKGYAERIPDPEGGIARKFRPSPAGENLLNEERDASTRKISEVLDDWSQEDLHTFMVLLRRMNRAVEKRIHRPWPRP